MGNKLQTWSTIISAIRSIPWLTQWLIVRDVDVDWIAAAGWTPLQGAVGWMVLVVFVCVGPDWWALYLLRYRTGKVVSVMLQDRGFCYWSAIGRGVYPKSHIVDLDDHPGGRREWGEADCRPVQAECSGRCIHCLLKHLDTFFENHYSETYLSPRIGSGYHIAWRD